MRRLVVLDCLLRHLQNGSVCTQKVGVFCFFPFIQGYHLSMEFWQWESFFVKERVLRVSCSPSQGRGTICIHSEYIPPI